VDYAGRKKRFSLTLRERRCQGKSVGVEIGEWLNEDEIATSKSKEKREAAYLEAIGDHGERFTRNIEYIWLYARKSRVNDNDRAALRVQLFTFVAACDERWPRERYWATGPILKKGIWLAGSGLFGCN